MTSSPSPIARRLYEATDAAITCGVAAVDTDGRQIHVNDGFTRMLGWERDELLGKMPPFVYWPSEERARIEEAMRIARDGRLPSEGVAVRLCRRSGERFPCLLLVAPWLDGGELQGWVANVIDLTAHYAQLEVQREADARIHAARVRELDLAHNQLDLLQHATRAGLWEWDLDSGQHRWTLELFRLFGLNAGAAEPGFVTWDQVVHPEDRASAYQQIQEARSELRALHCHYRIRWPDGQVRWIESFGQVHGHSDTRSMHYIGICTDITERLNNEAQRLQAERRWQFALEGAEQGVWDWNLVSGKVTYSPQYKRMLGQRDEEPFSDSIEAALARIHPDDLPATNDAVSGHLSGRTPYFRLEQRMRRRDGSYVWTESRGRIAEHGPDGRASRMIGVQYDISARRETEAALDQAKARLRAAMASMSEAICIYDTAGNPVEFNDAFVRLHRFDGLGMARRTGRSHADLLKLTLADGSPVAIEDWPAQRALRTDTAVEIEYRMQRIDTGETWDCTFSHAPLLDSTSTVVGAVVTGRDVSVRKAAEQVLRRSDARRAFLLRLNDALRRLSDADEVGLQASKLLCEHVAASRVGWAEDVGDGIHVDVVGDHTRGVASLVGRYQYLDYGADLLRALRSGQTCVRTDTAFDPHLGERERQAHQALDLGATVNVPLIKDGMLSAMLFVHSQRARSWSSEEVALFEDVAERIWADVQRVRVERAMAQQADALRLAKEAADAANQAKSTFLANMSHEIRTPMHAIVGYGQILRRLGIDPAHLECLDAIDQACEHLLSIIDDVLDLAKIESGHLSLREAPLKLDALVDTVRALVAGAARQKGLELRVELGDVPLSLVGDEARLRQALLNLAGNAVKFTAAGSITLASRTVEETGNNVTVRFDVTDTGIGIHPDHLDRLFMPFEQIDASPTREYGGSGLGLAITRRLSRMMGGEVGVHSEPGQGSTFWFTARMRRLQPHECVTPRLDTVPRRTAPGAAPGASSARATGTVLLVEDNRANRVLARRMLQQFGLQVEEACDGADAVDKASRRRYDLVLMDLNMPGMDGLSATRRIRQLPGWSDIPIVAVTGNAFDATRKACLDASMDAFLTKPIRWSAAGDLLAQVLGSASKPTRRH